MRHALRILACLLAVSMTTPAMTAPVILNEYNAVGNNNRLDDGNGADMFFGTIDGNGGNWFELLVIDDQLDMRGWKLSWTEDETSRQHHGRRNHHVGQCFDLVQSAVRNHPDFHRNRQCGRPGGI